MSKRIILVVGLWFVTALGLSPLDEPGSTSKGDVRESSATLHRRLPSHFGQIGLSDRQKQGVYEVRGRHRAEIERLTRRIEELKAAEMSECEAILTEAQRKLLERARGARARHAANEGGGVASK